MMMKPIGWTKRRVQLECQLCHRRTKVEWSAYISALESGAKVRCAECGTAQLVQDRRQAPVPVATERRAAIRA